MIDLAALLPICTSRISPPHLPSPSSLAHLPSPSPLPISPPHLPSPSSLAHLPSPTPDLFTAPATLRTTLPFPHLPIFAFSPLHPLRLPIRLRPRKWRWQLQSKRHGVPMHTPTLHSLTRSHLTRCTRSCIFVSAVPTCALRAHAHMCAESTFIPCPAAPRAIPQGVSTPPPQLAPPQLAPPQLAPPQLAPPQLAPPQLAPPQLAPPQLAPPQLAPPQLAPPQLAPPQLG
ncbi:unnamed protein product [Closterium sp. NIES-53]